MLPDAVAPPPLSPAAAQVRGREERINVWSRMRFASIKLSIKCRGYDEVTNGLGGVLTSTSGKSRSPESSAGQQISVTSYVGVIIVAINSLACPAKADGDPCSGTTCKPVPPALQGARAATGAAARRNPTPFQT
jgi:hypothetical protein